MVSNWLTNALEYTQLWAMSDCTQFLMWLVYRNQRTCCKLIILWDTYSKQILYKMHSFMALFCVVTVFYSISYLLSQDQKSIDRSDRKIKTLGLNNTHSKT